MCRRLCQPNTPFENFLVRFSDPKYFLSVHHFWVVADDRHFLGPIFGPKIVLSVPHFWVLAGDGYFFSPIFGPKIVFSVHHLWVVADNGKCYTLIMTCTLCLNLIGNLIFYNHVASALIPKNYLDCSVEFFSASILL